MLSHVPGLQTYNSKQPFSLVNGVAVQIYRQASKLTTSPGSLRLHIEITCDYITLQIYMRPAKRQRTGLLRNLEDAVEFLAQCRHILSDFIVGNSGIDLGRGDAFMPQHLADGLQRYALRKRDRCGKGMPRAMDRGVERQAGVSGNMP